MQNNNVKMVDLPFFELCNQAPISSSSSCAMATAEDSNNKYVYYLAGSAFYRYDTIADTWQQLASPLVTANTVVSLRYTAIRGFHGRVISAASNTITIPGLRGSQFDQQQIRILNGTGAGQVKTLTYTGETIHDTGMITAALTNGVQDSLKKWIPNQWVGYTVAITYGQDNTQYKKILYNDTNTLYISDATLQPHDPWNNQSFVAIAPYNTLSATASSQAHFLIMSSSYTVNGTWSVIPDNTSFFTLLTGGLYAVTSASSSPFFSFMYYDVIHDSWQMKNTPAGIIPAQLGTDVSIERTAKLGTAFVSNIGVVSSTNRTLVDAGLSLVTDRYANHRIFITGGTGIGQTRRIVNHLSNTFTVEKNWDVNPDSTSTYEVWSDTDKVYLAGSANSALLAYSPEKDYWAAGHTFDDGVLSAGGMTVSAAGWLPIPFSSTLRLAAGITSISSTPTAGGTGYSLGDILTCAVGGTGAQVIVTSITSSGATGGIVTGLQILHNGATTGYSVSSGVALTGGTGTGCTLNITGVGVTGLCFTANNHFFKAGNVITFNGCTEAAYSLSHTIVGVPTVSSFCYITTATAVASATTAPTSTVLVDPTKNWIVNEHVGRIVHKMTASLVSSPEPRWIVSNTATTLTFSTAWNTQVANSKYTIYDAKIFGTDDQRKEPDKAGYGYATSGSTTTLVDTNKNWIPNQWVNYYFKVESGVGYASGRILITSNTNNTLTYAVQSFTPTATTKYEIADSWGLNTTSTLNTVTETTNKNWAVNQWAGKRVRITAGTLFGSEAAITTNTTTSLTSSIGTPDTTSAYAILSPPPKSTGIELIHVWGSTDATKKGRYIYCARGASNAIDIYDITTGKWIYGTFFSPQSEVFTSGSSYCYDGKDTIYLGRSVQSSPLRIFALDTNKNQISGALTATVMQNGVHVGNFLEIVNDPTNTVKYIYTLQNSGTILSRALLF